uniref:Glucosamine/galactosamine-6-phosphate isomerase domain-containing protein n=1 Tax=Calidris pygmaea TaxID=425635 RepID=A0A8C3PPF1_9CHAR
MAAAACRVSVFPSPQELGPALAQLVAERAAAAAGGSGGRFSLGLSGGSLVGILSRDLPPAAVGPAAPAGWLVAFCDERLVPPEHPESTLGAYKAQLLPRLPGPGPRVLALTPGLAPAAAAEDYAAQLRQVPAAEGGGVMLGVCWKRSSPRFHLPVSPRFYLRVFPRFRHLPVSPSSIISGSLLLPSSPGLSPLPPSPGLSPFPSSPGLSPFHFPVSPRFHHLPVSS